ncbi:uroporphyrinogen-III synthase [Nicoletella semolina]|uniref:Uroporphyrinogen-III synthase n=1 Tax=Nicoletella semolina TaxID=271160 RepID=A0A4R2NCQ3_9PAST|nr:uroporphyrinogen-III synthase [Nicoletella semolina]MDH2924203.1 uroporphyrinogen-III synthase [Nicoletella semolina]TCP18900.1 uroporphyrinogen-III synthase [Nicoletella semolina]
MNILVTRPDERGAELVKMLAQQQILAIHQPLFTIVAGRELARLIPMLAELKSGDYVFAVSKNAVDFSSEALRETGFGWRDDLIYLAVGQKTASYFSLKSGQATHYPIVSEDSEGLLALAMLQDLCGKKVLILRAETGRDFFAKSVLSRGAEIQTLECYQRISNVNQLGEKLNLAKRVGINAIIVSSNEILSILLENTQVSEQEWLFSCKLIVVSERIANYAEQLGWHKEKIILSPKATNTALLETILKISSQ